MGRLCLLRRAHGLAYGMHDAQRPAPDWKTSCGVLVTDGRRLLLGHASPTSRWDIPKGGMEAGETAVEAALRELRAPSDDCSHRFRSKPATCSIEASWGFR